MKYGDKDGFNEIYDGNGELVLHPNEKVLVVEENVVPTFKSTWRYYGGDYLLEPSKGTIYLTNERMVFINIPERMFAISGDESRAVGSDMEKNFELGDLSPGEATREYFDIPNIEVMASEKKEGAVSVGEMVNVYVLSSGNQFHLSMVLPSDSDLLGRLMNKQVENLDQLVNNLKDYFQKDEWMFTEQEKKLYAKLTPKVPEPVGEGDIDDSAEQDRSKADTQKKEPAVPVDYTIPRKRLHDGLGNGSVRYFQNLHRKGLIKDEIFRRLMTQYGIDPEVAMAEQTPSSPEMPPMSGQEPVLAGPVEPGQDEGPESTEPLEIPAESDDQLLSMLNDTLSDFTDEPEGSEKVPADATEPEVPKDG